MLIWKKIIDPNIVLIENEKNKVELKDEQEGDMLNMFKKINMK